MAIYKGLKRVFFCKKGREKTGKGRYFYDIDEL
jgi:hypothetical protein